MSRLGCRCGNVMGSTESPSPYSINVYYEREILQAITENKNLTVIDFLTNWDEKNGCRKQYMKRKEMVDYWYCTECKRVYECQIKIGGHWLRVYQKKEVEGSVFSEQKEYTRLYIFSELLSDKATEENPGLLLNDFINDLSKVYYANGTEEEIYVVEKESNKLLYIYEIEEVIPS